MAIFKIDTDGKMKTAGRREMNFLYLPHAVHGMYVQKYDGKKKSVLCVPGISLFAAWAAEQKTQ